MAKAVKGSRLNFIDVPEEKGVCGEPNLESEAYACRVLLLAGGVDRENIESLFKRERKCGFKNAAIKGGAGRDIALLKV